MPVDTKAIDKQADDGTAALLVRQHPEHRQTHQLAVFGLLIIMRAMKVANEGANDRQQMSDQSFSSSSRVPG